jgi:hypothetical protein
MVSAYQNTLRPGLSHFASFSFLIVSIAFWFLGSSCSSISKFLSEIQQASTAPTAAMPCS